ncbi:MAG: carbohydrate ABC transporter permease [Clostridiales bacterium]|jgi:putative aldouronate transport system permease protein|nr:carbohydrate ABC transporter permease [Clostridiales bacterium]
MKKTEAFRQSVFAAVFAVICLAVLFPLILVVSVSLSNETEIVFRGYGILPRGFDLSAYQYIFKKPMAVLNAYKVTATFAVVGTAMSVLLTSMLSYTLSKRNLRRKNAISFYVYFTMLFSGGLVPTYILVSQYLGLEDSIWVYILPCMINPWYVFMMRTFFQGIPYEVAEAALVDGANEYKIYWNIYMPLSKPMLATIALFLFLARWNDWYTAMLYINRDELVSLQYLLQRIMDNIALLQNSENMRLNIMDYKDVPSETVRMAMAVIVAGPALVIFPFFQKYFVKGVTVGAVKG